MRIELEPGVFVGPRMADQIAELKRKVGSRIPINLTQGSWASGKFSAGTHGGDGAADASVLHPRKLTAAEIGTIVRCAREVGLWAWHRRLPEWTEPEHIHMISVGCTGLSDAAAAQIDDARKGLNGLASHGKDRHAAMKLPVITWEQYLEHRDAPVPVPVKRDPKQKVTDVHVPGSRTIKLGDAGTDVTALRAALGMDPAKDWFGPGCDAAVKRYQRLRGTKQDGIVGPVTWGFLLGKAAA